jgi:hypothetical protein
MFFKWLTEEFPREMERGWRLIKADMPFWCGVAAVLALLAVSPLWAERGGELRGAALVVFALATLLRVLLAPLLLATAAIRFQAATTATPVTWAETARAVSRRIVAVLFAWVIGAGLSRGVALLAQAVVVAVLQAGETPMTAVRAWAGLIGWAVFLGFLVRFAFVPFLVALERTSAPRQYRGPGGLVRRLAAPLLESNRMTAEVRGRLVPYLALGLFAPAAVAIAPSPLRPIASFGLHLLSFTALAVVFCYYVERTRAEG